MMRAFESCPHFDRSGGGGGPGCRLVSEILGLDPAPAVPVGLDACRACCAGPIPDVRRMGPVVASLASRAAEDVERSGGVPGCDALRAAEVRRRAESQLLAYLRPPPRRTIAAGARSGSAGPTTAVVIPCHNHGRFLDEAIRSVLAQTTPADEIIVVDDASDDDTAEVARRHADSGVAYRRVAFRSVYRARNEGIAATRSEILCFLDADDVLPADFLERGLALFDAPDVGIVYPDLEYFGEQTGRRAFPAFERGELEARNYMPATSLVRRRALEIADGFGGPDAADVLEDWLVWRRVVDAGWRGVKHPCALRYRRHPVGNSSLSARFERAPYYDYAALRFADVTIVTPLSGRSSLWPAYRDWLDAQHWPRERSQVFLVDSSRDAGFSREVRSYLASCDYPATRYLSLDVAERGLADLPRAEAADAVNLACARIYNRIAREVVTPYILVVEDDILPPLGVVERLLRSMDESTGAVAAPYRSRFHDAYVAWEDGFRHLRGGEGVQEIAGSGFGCLLLRRAALVGETFLFGYDERHWFDHAFCDRLRRSGWRMKIDWTQECEHRDARSLEPA